MKNILHTIDTNETGGAESVFMTLATSLDPSKYRSFAAIKSEGWMSGQLRKLGLNPLFVDAKGSFNLKYLFQLVRIVHKYKIDIIQSHLFGSNVYCSLAGLICRVPVISVFHGFVDVIPTSRLLGAKFSILNMGSTFVVFVSQSLKKAFVKGGMVSADKSVVIYNGVDTNIFTRNRDQSIRNQLGLSDSDVVIGSIGDIRQAKGYDDLLHAAALLVKRSTKYKFIIAGDTSGKLYDELLQLRDRLGLNQHLFFLGFREDAARVFNNFDIFLLSSTTEGFSIATIEAMACGLPVVVTRSGGPEEIVSDGKNGILVDVASPPQIASALERVADDQPLRERLELGARETATSKFSMHAMLRAYEKIYGGL